MKQQLKEPEKIKLGFYSYTYVRTTVMRALLFRRDDYQKLLKMSFSEIAKFLQDSNYRKEINELATKYSGADLIELALNRNLAASFQKLLRISSPEIGMLVAEYVKRKDIEDLKTILRGKFTNSDEEKIAASIIGAGNLGKDFLLSLLKKDSLEDILKIIGMIDMPEFKIALKEFKNKNNLAGIENALDKHYYINLIQFSRRLPKQGALFRQFFHKEVDILNILTLLRLKEHKFTKEEIRNFIIPYGDKAKDLWISNLLNADGLDNLAKSLEKTGYGDIISKGMEDFKKTKSLITLEIGLYKHLLKQTILFMHQHLLSIDVILGYMFAKDIEVRNLKIIVKGKQLGLNEQFIESQLIYE
ncbi:MAG TPA: ATP synthase A1 subunit C [Candidatus Nanoarchaeia archaeon]|nr:ATP synthase A1 subunit C [Candidatus Nanoarchaeia archaeon]